MNESKKLEPVVPHDALKALDKFYVEARELLAQDPPNFNFMAYACSSGEEHDQVVSSRYAEPDAIHTIMVSVASDPHILAILTMALTTIVSGAYEMREGRSL